MKLVFHQAPILKQQQQLNERLAEQQATFSGQTRQQM